MSARIVRVFTDVNMSLSHPGLREYLKSNKIAPDSLDDGEFIVFVNRAMDKIKLMAAGNIFAYLRLDKGRKVDMRVISQIPRLFTAKRGLDYDKGLEEMLKARLQS